MWIDSNRLGHVNRFESIFPSLLTTYVDTGNLKSRHQACMVKSQDYSINTAKLYLCIGMSKKYTGNAICPWKLAITSAHMYSSLMLLVGWLKVHPASEKSVAQTQRLIVRISLNVHSSRELGHWTETYIIITGKGHS